MHVVRVPIAVVVDEPGCFAHLFLVMQALHIVVGEVFAFVLVLKCGEAVLEFLRINKASI